MHLQYLGQNYRKISVEIIIIHKIHFSDLQPDTVTQFLFDNPDFLDTFVSQHVHEDRIRQWSQRKHRVQGHNAVTLTNGRELYLLTHYLVICNSKKIS